MEALRAEQNAAKTACVEQTRAGIPERLQNAHQTGEVRQQLQGEPAEPVGPPPDPHQAEKDRYKQETLVKIKDIKAHLEALIKAHPKRIKGEEAEKEAGANRLAFEATLEYAVEKGLSPLMVVQEFMRGVNGGLFPQTYSSFLERLTDKVPAFDYFMQPDVVQKREVFRKKADAGESAFRDFYWKEVMTQNSVREKVKTTENPKTQNQAAAEKAYVSALNYLTANRGLGKKNPEAVRGALGRFLVVHGITIAGRAFSADHSLFRFTEAAKTGRISPDSSQKTVTLAEADREIWNAIQPWESKLFRLLKKPDLKLDELQGYLREKYAVEIASFDDFYGKIDEILNVVLPNQKQ